MCLQAIARPRRFRQRGLPLIVTRRERGGAFECRQSLVSSGYVVATGTVSRNCRGKFGSVIAGRSARNASMGYTVSPR